MDGMKTSARLFGLSNALKAIHLYSEFPKYMDRFNLMISLSRFLVWWPQDRIFIIVLTLPSSMVFQVLNPDTFVSTSAKVVADEEPGSKAERLTRCDDEAYFNFFRTLDEATKSESKKHLLAVLQALRAQSPDTTIEIAKNAKGFVIGTHVF
jgi:hypothetical protein